MTPKVPKGLVDAAEEEIREDEVDEVAAQLEALGAELQSVAKNKVARQDTLRKIETLLGGLQLKDFQELADSPIVQKFVELLGYGDLQPGQTANRGTLAERTRDWSLKDLQARPKETWIPFQDMQITWNGVGPFFLKMGQKCTYPDVIYAEYERIIEAQHQARINEAYMFGMSDEAPHPNWQTPEGAAVRATSIAGRRLGRPGGSMGVGVLTAEAKEEAASGEQ